MDYVSKNKPIFKHGKIKKQDPLSDKFLASEKVTSDISQIEKELSISLKLLESGLSNLDIEAAHFLNPPGFKDSFSSKEEFSLSKIPARTREKKTIEFSHNSSTISPLNQANDCLYLPKSSTRSKSQNVSVPPDLTFSFYSTKEEIIPYATLLSQMSQIPKSGGFCNSSCPSDPTLDEILSSSVESIFSKNCELKSEIKEKIEFNLETELDAGKKTSDYLDVKTEANGSIIVMDDLVESLMKIKSALDDLDKEAAHMINPTGLDVSFLDL